MVEIGNDLHKAASLLNTGEVIGIPTETVYGLAANALNAEAVTNIFSIKKRPTFDPLIVHIKGIDEVKHYTKVFPEKAQILAKAFWPGPLTLILPKNNNIPDIVTSGLDFVGLRVPKHPITLQLLNELEFPLAAPSANPFGYVSPTSAAHVADQLGESIPYIIDGGNCEIGIESTIVMFENPDKPVVLRLGGLDISSIEKLIGKVELNIATHSKPNAPGQLDKHYATKTPLYFMDTVLHGQPDPTLTGVISFVNKPSWGLEENCEILSKNGSTYEAARNLFAAMRVLDGKNLKCILVDKFPENGLGPAINDRLARACYKK